MQIPCWIHLKKICEKKALSLVLLGFTLLPLVAQANPETLAAWKAEALMERTNSDGKVIEIDMEKIAVGTVITQKRVFICFATRRSYAGKVRYERRMLSRDGHILIDQTYEPGEIVGRITDGNIKVRFKSYTAATSWYEKIELKIRRVHGKILATLEHEERNSSVVTSRQTEWLKNRLVVPGNGTQVCPIGSSNYLKEAVQK